MPGEILINNLTQFRGSEFSTLDHMWRFFYETGLSLPEMAQKQSRSPIFATPLLAYLAYTAHINVKRSQTNVVNRRGGTFQTM